MILTTTGSVPGREVAEVLGVVRGNTIRAAHVGHDIKARMRHVIGGEISDYTKLMGEAREQALDRMMQAATQMEADAVVGVRFATSGLMGGAAELLAYGTAVKLKSEL